MEKQSKFITSFEEHLVKRYGQVGSKKRDEFEVNAKTFAINEILKEKNQKSKFDKEQYVESNYYQIV